MDRRATARKVARVIQPSSTVAIPTPSAKTASPADKLPAWYPAWARELADLYFSGTTCLFVLHGNVHDLIRCPDGEEDAYCNLAEFLATQVFGTWDLVLGLRSEPRAAAAGRPRCQAAAGHAAIPHGPLGRAGQLAARSRPGAAAVWTPSSSGTWSTSRRRARASPCCSTMPSTCSRRATSTRWPAARRRGWCGSCAGRRIRSSSR